MAWFIFKVPTHAKTLSLFSPSTLRLTTLTGPLASMHQGCSEWLGLGKTQGFRDAIQSFKDSLSIWLHGFRGRICQCRVSAWSFGVLPTQHGQHGGQSIPKKFRHCEWLGSRPCRMLASAKRILRIPISELSQYKRPFYRSGHSI